jgi:hypothetical protein
MNTPTTNKIAANSPDTQAIIRAIVLKYLRKGLTHVYKNSLGRPRYYGRLDIPVAYPW